MLTIRILEEELQKLCLEGEAGDLHFYKGQEAIAVGAHAALRESDYIVAHHRTIPHAVMRDVPLRHLVGELLGKRSGMWHGRAGEMHMSYPNKRFMFSFQLVGTCVPVAAGLAWAVKNVREEDAIVAVFHGEAAMSNGQWHEGMNLAAVQKVPLLLICEDNGLAGNIRQEYYSPMLFSERRAVAYNVAYGSVDGNDVAAVQREVASAAEHVRSKSEPFLLVCNTTRLSWHKQGQRDVRDQAELDALARFDPIPRMRDKLNLDDSAHAALFSEVQREVRHVIDSVRREQVL